MALAVKTPENILIIQGLKTKTWVRRLTWFAIVKNETKIAAIHWLTIRTEVSLHVTSAWSSVCRDKKKYNWCHLIKFCSLRRSLTTPIKAPNTYIKSLQNAIFYIQNYLQFVVFPCYYYPCFLLQAAPQAGFDNKDSKIFIKLFCALKCFLI